MEPNFTEDEFHYLEHLKNVYDASNTIFLNRRFDNYIPVGLAIVYMATYTDSSYLKDAEIHNK